MLMAELPLAVLMRWRRPASMWDQARWRPEAVSVDRADASAQARALTPDSRLLHGVALQLYPDENDGYFENWAAPEPKIFLLWRVENDEPAIVSASASYGEGTRMLDSGDQADGIAMPPDIHAWLGSYLLRHYEPPARGKRNHG
ncbi:DUF3305 domain-containing protein [Noviherbaspirillum sp. 1P10PC]|uniref:DUF3305 domain-containing protein n=1 Tax=Noviherbaspirillum sp. 1P10PC TaxID=3132292 RepID=UPI00399F03CD